MKKVHPYKLASNAIKAFDNGGRFYNFLTKAGDQEISVAELGRVAGVMSDRQSMSLFLEMAIHDLQEDERKAVKNCLSAKLRDDLSRHPIQRLTPAQASRNGRISEAAIITGTPSFLEDKSEMSGFIMVPIMAGKVMTFSMIPIFDQYDLYELRGADDPRAALLATLRGSERLPEIPHRFGGLLKESTEDKDGKEKGRCFLEASYVTPLDH